MVFHTLSSLSAPCYPIILITVTALILNLYNVFVSVTVWRHQLLKWLFWLLKTGCYILSSPHFYQFHAQIAVQIRVPLQNIMVTSLFKKSPALMLLDLHYRFKRSFPQPDESSHTLSLCSFLNMRHYISQPFKSEGTILHTPKYETIRLGRNTWRHIIHSLVNSIFVFRIGEVR